MVEESRRRGAYKSVNVRNAAIVNACGEMDIYFKDKVKVRHTDSLTSDCQLPHESTSFE